MDDLARPLTPKGLEEAARVGVYLADEQLIPDLALISSAQRARETWDVARGRLGDVPARSEPRLYGASPDGILTMLRGIEAGVRTLLMVGHNPGFEELAKLLAGSGDHDSQARLMQGYPPAGLAVIDFSVEDWGEAAPHSGRLDRFVTPCSLGLSAGIEP
jgi:phosphohistidine phosphatase